MSRVLDDADEQPVEPEVLDRRARERDVPDVRRVEGAAEDADAHGCPLELLVADLDHRAGADARGPQRLLELVAVRGVADDAEAAVGAQDPERAVRGGLGR